MHEPNALPWTRSCFVCGAENPHGLQLRSQTDGSRVWIDFTPRPCDVGYRQIVDDPEAIAPARLFRHDGP